MAQFLIFWSLIDFGPPLNWIPSECSMTNYSSYLIAWSCTKFENRTLKLKYSSVDAFLV